MSKKSSNITRNSCFFVAWMIFRCLSQHLRHFHKEYQDLERNDSFLFLIICSILQLLLWNYHTSLDLRSSRVQDRGLCLTPVYFCVEVHNRDFGMIHRYWLPSQWVWLLDIGSLFLDDWLYCRLVAFCSILLSLLGIRFRSSWLSYYLKYIIFHFFISSYLFCFYYF